MKFSLIASSTFIALTVASIGVALGGITCTNCTLGGFRPVCGKVGGKLENFPSMCAFEITECYNRENNGPKVELLHEGNC